MSAEAIQTAVWLRPEQAGFVRSVADLAGLTLTHAGGPDPSTGTAGATALGCAHAGDLRSLLQSGEAKLILLADAGDFGAGRNDADAALTAEARGARIVSLGPTPASAIELYSNGWARPRAGREPYRAIEHLYRPVRTPVWRTTADMLEHFGPVRSCAIGAALPADAGGLDALILGAIETALQVTGDADTVYAAHAPAIAGGGLHAAPGDTLRALSGDAHITIRGATTLCTLRLTSGAPRATFVARFDGPSGAVVTFDDAIGWWGPDGAERDRATGLGAEAMDAAELTARAIGRVLEPGQADRPFDTEGVLTVAQAALLSMTTGQAERPEMVSRIVRSA